MPDSTASDWPLQAARDGLSQLVKAAAERPQTVTVHGKPAAIVLSPAEYQRLRRRARGPLSAALLQPGLALSEGELPRRRVRERERPSTEL